MPIAFFLAPYKKDTKVARRRYCAMDDFTPIIYLDQGSWSEVEVLGNVAIVKVNAAADTLTAIAAAEGFTRLPLNHLNTPLSTLTANQRAVVRDRILALGYTAEEITERLGSNLGQRTLGDILRFMARRRIKPRFDELTQTHVFEQTNPDTQLSNVVDLEEGVIDALDLRVI